MKIDELKNVTVIGAGAMGHGIAQVALMSGYDVTLCDIKMSLSRGANSVYLKAWISFAERARWSRPWWTGYAARRCTPQLLSAKL